MVKITDFRVFKSRIDFEVDGQEYHTDVYGEGLWQGSDYTKQVEGCLDFQLHQKTRAGVMRFLKKYFEEV